MLTYINRSFLLNYLASHHRQFWLCLSIGSKPKSLAIDKSPRFAPTSAFCGRPSKIGGSATSSIWKFLDVYFNVFPPNSMHLRNIWHIFQVAFAPKAPKSPGQSSITWDDQSEEIWRSTLIRTTLIDIKSKVHQDIKSKPQANIHIHYIQYIHEIMNI